MLGATALTYLVLGEVGRLVDEDAADHASKRFADSTVRWWSSGKLSNPSTRYSEMGRDPLMRQIDYVRMPLGDSRQASMSHNLPQQ